MKKNKSLKCKRAQKIICAVLVALACVTAIAFCFQFDTSAVELKLCPNSPDGEHKYSGGFCLYCQKALTCTSHKWYNGNCTVCGFSCPHTSFTEDGECATCDYKCTHSGYSYIYTTISADSHMIRCSRCHYSFGSSSHIWNGSTCSACSYTCTKHDFDSNGECLNCGYVCSHSSYSFSPIDNERHNLVCNTCGFVYSDSHNYVNGTCTLCSYSCTSHVWNNGTCTNCGVSCPHTSFTDDGECATCDYKCTHSGYSYIYTTISADSHITRCSRCHYSFGTSSHTWNGSTCSACGYGCTHSYIMGTCTNCGASCPHNYTIRFDHSIKCTLCEFPYIELYDTDSITYLSSPFFTRYGNSTNFSPIPTLSEIDWHIYVNSPSDYSTASLDTPSVLTSLERYVFVKYRVVGDTPTFTTLKLVVDGVIYNCGGVSKGTTYNGWVTVLIDLDSIVTAHSFGDTHVIQFRFQHHGEVELSYIAMDNSVDDLCALLDDQDIFYECYNDNYAPLLMSSSAYRVEYDKDFNNIHSHVWNNGKCSGCGSLCTHEYSDSVCNICGLICPHSKRTFTSVDEYSCLVSCVDCLVTLATDEHLWNNSACTNCGFSCPHSVFIDGSCSACGLVCSHEWASGMCSICLLPCSHHFINDICTFCGVEYVVPPIDIEDGFLKLITAVYDAQVTTFNSLLNYDIWGINIANFMVALVMLAIFAFFIRKFMGR